MRVYIVRHPETEFNQKEIVQGWADSNLTEKGKRIAERLGMRLKNKDIAKIYSSDLGRAMQTAKIINKYLNVEIIPKTELRERNFGKFNGKPVSLIKQKVDLEDGVLVLPNGESIKEMKKRVLQFIKQLKEKKPVLMVTHEGCLRVILTEKYNVKLNSARGNTSSEKIYNVKIKD